MHNFNLIRAFNCNWQPYYNKQGSYPAEFLEHHNYILLSNRTSEPQRVYVTTDRTHMEFFSRPGVTVVCICNPAVQDFYTSIAKVSRMWGDDRPTLWPQRQQYYIEKLDNTNNPKCLKAVLSPRVKLREFCYCCHRGSCNVSDDLARSKDLLQKDAKGNEIFFREIPLLYYTKENQPITMLRPCLCQQ